jgi:hypothetical protein
METLWLCSYFFQLSVARGRRVDVVSAFYIAPFLLAITIHMTTVFSDLHIFNTLDSRMKHDGLVLMCNVHALPRTKLALKDTPAVLIAVGNLAQGAGLCLSIRDAFDSVSKA